MVSLFLYVFFIIANIKYFILQKNLEYNISLYYILSTDHIIFTIYSIKFLFTYSDIIIINLYLVLTIDTSTM